MCNKEVLQKAEEGMKESNKILIQELVKDLEQNGIQPVVAVDGIVKKLKIADEKELQNMGKEAEKFGLTRNDFCLMKEDCKHSKIEKIILVYKKSGKIKEYTSKLHWILDFHRDLKNKVFS